MASHGFTVTKNYLGLATAFRAEFTHGEGGRVLGVNSGKEIHSHRRCPRVLMLAEYDALKGIGESV
jgi:metal-dependent amidase/aminoacylase/carboxypeptidase family protein